MQTAATKTIKIVVNGQVREVPAAQSLAGILAFLEIDRSRVAVELNRSIVSRSAWDDVRIDDSATLEIVQFVGGG